MTDQPTKRPRRSAREIAQAHADKAVAALEKHDEKIAKLNDKIEGLQDQLAELWSQRRNLEREADYRQAHPLLVEEPADADAEQPQLEVVETEQQDEYNPFA